MNKCYFHKIWSLLIFTILFSLSVNPAHAWLHRLFDAKSLTLDSDVVCKVRILGVREEGTLTIPNCAPQFIAARMVTRVEVISVIKGKPPKLLEIAFPQYPRTNKAYLNGPIFTNLSIGEVCLVFLSGNKTPYSFCDSSCGKMTADPEKFSYEIWRTPLDKLLAELIGNCGSKNERIKLRAISEIGRLGDRQAAQTLRNLSNTDDVVVRGEALAARIQIGDWPTLEELLAFLSLDPKTFDDEKAAKRFPVNYLPPITGYSLADLQFRLVLAVAGSTGAGWYSHFGSSTKKKDFDYVTFFRKAMQLDTFSKNSRNSRDIASAFRKLADKRAVPDLMMLLGSSEQETRYYAATALATIYKKKSQFPDVDQFAADENRYISYWENWWKEHQTEFKTEP